MAFTPCTTAGLTVNLAKSCTEPRIKGYEQIGVIILKSDLDLDNTAVDVANPRLISTLALKTEKKATSMKMK